MEYLHRRTAAHYVDVETRDALDYSRLCGRNASPQKSMPFAARGRCALLPERAAKSEASLTDTALHHLIRSFSQATSEDRHLRDTTARVLAYTHTHTPPITRCRCKRCEMAS